jgi:hypothetical protein
MDTDLDILVTDKGGNNLLNPSFPDSFKEDSIKIYYIIKGVKTEVFKPNLDYPRMFYIWNDGDDGEYRMRLFPNDADDDQYPKTLIEWETDNLDTLACHFKRNMNNVICDEIWLNGMLLDDEITGNRMFTIVK